MPLITDSKTRQVHYKPGIDMPAKAAQALRAPKFITRGAYSNLDVLLVELKDYDALKSYQEVKGGMLGQRVLKQRLEEQETELTRATKGLKQIKNMQTAIQWFRDKKPLTEDEKQIVRSLTPEEGVGAEVKQLLLTSKYVSINDQQFSEYKTSLNTQYKEFNEKVTELSRTALERAQRKQALNLDQHKLSAETVAKIENLAYQGSAILQLMRNVDKALDGAPKRGAATTDEWKMDFSSLNRYDWPPEYMRAGLRYPTPNPYETFYRPGDDGGNLPAEGMHNSPRSVAQYLNQAYLKAYRSHKELVQSLAKNNPALMDTLLSNIMCAKEEMLTICKKHETLYNTSRPSQEAYDLFSWQQQRGNISVTGDQGEKIVKVWDELYKVHHRFMGQCQQALDQVFTKMQETEIEGLKAVALPAAPKIKASASIDAKNIMERLHRNLQAVDQHLQKTFTENSQAQKLARALAQDLYETLTAQLKNKPSSSEGKIRVSLEVSALMTDLTRAEDTKTGAPGTTAMLRLLTALTYLETMQPGEGRKMMGMSSPIQLQTQTVTQAQALSHLTKQSSTRHIRELSKSGLR